MTGQFFAVLFLARELAHRAHLAESSYARHQALGTFYEDVGRLIDELIEAYQGRMLRRVDVPLVDNEFTGSPLESMQAQLKWLETNRHKAVPRDDSALQNIVDEIVALYLRTIYKLQFLK